jgi:hypothetical protein
MSALSSLIYHPSSIYCTSIKMVMLTTMIDSELHSSPEPGFHVECWISSIWARGSLIGAPWHTMYICSRLPVVLVLVLVFLIPLVTFHVHGGGVLWPCLLHARVLSDSTPKTVLVVFFLSCHGCAAGQMASGRNQREEAVVLRMETCNLHVL